LSYAFSASLSSAGSHRTLAATTPVPRIACLFGRLVADQWEMTPIRAVTSESDG
jgi:hypothetical protein